MRSVLLPFGLASALCACGSAPTTPETAAAPARAATVKAPDPLPPNTVRRSDVKAAISEGLGAFLQRVELDDRPVLVNGKFRGFRVIALVDPEFWRGIDIKPGDVITAVNGMPIEHPEQAVAAFDSLATASDIRVSFDRDGAARELRLTILDR